VATPGRLAHHAALGASSVDLSRLRFLVLDEADRLLTPPFAPDLAAVFALLRARAPAAAPAPAAGAAPPPPGAPALTLIPTAALTVGGAGAASAPPQLQVLLFSATVDAAVAALLAPGDAALAARFPHLARLRELLPPLTGAAAPLAVDVSPSDPAAALTVASLTQEYLFMPALAKNAYLVFALELLLAPSARAAAGAGAGAGAGAARGLAKRGKAAAGAAAAGGGLCRSAIVFADTCRGAQLAAELLLECGIPCVALHAVMAQSARLASLAQFKGGLVPVLVATDVASRGLDIPAVDLVLNYDAPRSAADYVHRVGRTARAGRRGRALTLVTQFDVDLVADIERGALRGGKLAAMAGVDEAAVLSRLPKVATAAQLAKNRLADRGLDAAFDLHAARKRAAAAARKADAAARGELPPAEAAGAGAGADADAAEPAEELAAPPPPPPPPPRRARAAPSGKRRRPA
jgi:superfamily II DNA/RNA helicase